MRYTRTSAVGLAAAALLSTTALASKRHPTPLPGAHGFMGPAVPQYHAPKKAKSGKWTAMANKYPADFPETALLLMDGTVMMHNGCTADWYRLTPDNTGSYQKGTWSKMPSMPSGYTPLYFSSAVLTDGHVMVEGGEYLNCNAVWTNQGAIYNSITDTWTTVTPPAGWDSIGDAQAVVLSDTQYMQADCCSTNSALATIKGDKVTWTATGTGKGDVYDEEAWTLLPNQNVLTVDANRGLGSPNFYELYSEDTGAWTTGTAKVPVSCVDPGSHEIGPATLMPNGLVFQICATAHTAVYDPLKDAWTAGPDLPNINGQLDSADGPAAVLPNGNVLMQVSPGVFNAPSHFIEVAVKDAKHVTMTQVDEPSSAAQQSSYEGRMLVLPTGEILWSSDVNDVQIYTPQGKPAKNAIPKIKKVAKALTVGSKDNVASGIGFNGLSEGGYYGDDAGMSTNFPIIRITNTASGHICFARTHDESVMGISDGTVQTTKFDVPAACETGASTLEVVVNGIASKAKKVTLS